MEPEIEVPDSITTPDGPDWGFRIFITCAIFSGAWCMYSILGLLCGYMAFTFPSTASKEKLDLSQGSFEPYDKPIFVDMGITGFNSETLTEKRIAALEDYRRQNECEKKGGHLGNFEDEKYIYFNSCAKNNVHYYWDDNTNNWSSKSINELK